MKIAVSTRLEAPANVVWETLQKTELLLYVMRPLLGVRGEFPKSWRHEASKSEVVRIERLMLFGVFPLWEHEIQLLHADETKRQALTSESGGPIRLWRHSIEVEPISGSSCRYTDRVEIEAGNLTPVVWLLAQLFYRHRQRRWRGLARILG